MSWRKVKKDIVNKNKNLVSYKNPNDTEKYVNFKGEEEERWLSSIMYLKVK